MEHIKSDIEYMKLFSEYSKIKNQMDEYEKRQQDLARKGSWNPTVSGTRFWIEDPRLDEINIEDIAHNLSRINRFNGGSIGEPYNVAHHCILGSYFIDENYALEFLLHDAAEAYTGDIVTYVKNVVREPFEKMESKINIAIDLKFNLNTSQECVKYVKQIDIQMLKAEARCLLPFKILPGLEKIPYVYPFDVLVIEPLNWKISKNLFIRRFNYLWEKREQKKASLRANTAADG